MKKTIFALIPVLSVMVVALLLVLPSAAAATPITTADQLLEIMNDSSKWGTSYVLANDIDLSTATNGMSQAPIGRSSATGNYYSGTFDGNGHSISGIDIDTGSTGYAGLFGYTNGTIKNLKIYGRVASTGKYTGGLVGVAASSVRVMNVESHVTVVGGSESTGGLVGALVPKGGKTSVISDVINYGTVTGTKYVGGILGFLQSESG